MFGCEWGKRGRNKRKDLSFRHVKTVSATVWNEHCVECAAPLCYGTCPKYRKRRDGRCKLFACGISKVGDDGLCKASVRVDFEGWGKLEAVFRPHQISRFHNWLIEFTSSLVFALSKVLSRVFERKATLKRWPSRAYGLREWLSAHANKGSNVLPQALYAYVQNDADEVDLILETKGSNGSEFKRTFHLKHGDNEFVVPYEDFVQSSSEISYIFITLSKPHSLVFHALDFVTFSPSFVEKRKNALTVSYPKGKFIKCVAWDLDNTVWDGVLIDGSVRLKEAVARVMRDLDSRGIVNSVISKNNHDEAMKQLQEFDLADLIVFPQINWLPKSHNLGRLAKQMNIGVDAICFIDDSPFELEEVKTQFPDVLCLDAGIATTILDEPCFQPPVSSDSGKRRLTYKMMEKEVAEKERWTGDINGFLKTCNICVEVSRPTEKDLPRCFELIQRTNQLNASGRRLSMEEITTMVNSNEFAAHVLRCHDKFGDYGIVGFSIYSKEEDAITDFVISCRVANKTIEQTYVQWLYEKRNNKSPLGFHYLKTNKNGPLFMVMESLGMKEEHGTDQESLIYRYWGDAERYSVVELVDKTGDL